MRLIACVTACLVPILADAAQMAPQLRPTVKRIVLIAMQTFIPIRVSPAKAAINSDRAIAGKQTGALLPCQERSASHRTARSNYPLKNRQFPRGLAPRLAADRPTAAGRTQRPFRVVCHEHRREHRRCATVREMKEGPSGSAIRCRSQATASCCGQKPWW